MEAMIFCDIKILFFSFTLGLADHFNHVNHIKLLSYLFFYCSINCMELT